MTESNGITFHCPICGRELRQWLEYTIAGMTYVLCPYCYYDIYARANTAAP